MLGGKSTWIFLELIIFDIYRLIHKICRYWRRLYIYIWFHMNLIWFRLISKYIWERNHFSIHIHLVFSFELRKCIAYDKAIWIHQKIFFLKDSENIDQNQKSHLNLNFSDGFRKCIPYQKAISIWIFQMDSELVFLTKKLSESIWIWIFQMDSETVFLAQRPSESIWIWIFQMDWENVYLSKKVTWIHLTLKFFHGYRKEILSFETTGTNVGGLDRSCFLLNDHLNPI